MAINLLTANLNQYGDSGQFEADRSTWGFTSSQLGLERSSVQKHSGLYSCGATGLTTGPFTYLQIAQGYYNSFTPGKKYFARAKVFVDNTSPIAADTLKLEVSPLDTASWFTITGKVRKTVLEARGAWVDLECYMDMTGGSVVSSLISVLLIAATNDQGDNVSVISGGKVWVDELEFFEYEEVTTPCTLSIDVPGTIVTHESAPAAGDGSIQVATTGGVGTLEYSKDGGGTWQLSNQFLGLANGVYDIRVREQATISCVAAQSFAVNESSYTFSFTVAKTDETISGAADGIIELTVSGTLAPFSFSKDGGATYQLGNIFNGLAAGTYTIVVKDSNNILRAQNVTIAAGQVIFDKAWFSRNPVTFGLSASPGWDALTNYRLYDDVRIEQVADSGVYVTTNLKAEQTPDVSGSAVFQVREAFRGLLVANPPSLNASTIDRLTDRIKLFKHFTGDLQDDEVTPATLTDSLPHLVLLGGISKFYWPTINFFTSYLPTNKKFMSWAPVEKEVDRAQEDYLNYFIFTVGVTSLKLRLKVYFDDATNTTSTVITRTGVNYGQLYQIPTGPVNSGALLVNPAKNAIKYELWLTDQADVIISEVRTYIISEVSAPNKRFFMFLNSLGSFEVLCFSGKNEYSSEVSKNTSIKYLPYNYAALDGEKQVNNSALQNSTQISTGFFTGRYGAAWRDYMRDFLLSRQVYDVTNGDRKPVIIQGGSYPMGADQLFQFYIRFTAMDAYEDENYTPDL